MIAGIVFGVVLLVAAVAAQWLLPRFPECWRMLPRERVVGLAIGCVAVYWSGRLVLPLVTEFSFFGLVKVAILPFGLFLVVSSYFFLDYLFTRAVGGMLLLVVNYLLHAAFVTHAPMRPMFAIVCYVLGMAGIFMIASPFRFRDLLRRATESPAWRRSLATVLMVAGLITAGVSVAATR
jgi:hypothetical protein